MANSRLRKLAAALGPAYVRVSGTWANTTYFPATDEVPAKPPSGFMGILTPAQWKGVVDFVKAVDGQIVASFAIGAGTRDAAGVWTSNQAKRLTDYTRSVGGSIAAAEFMNEPNLAPMGGAPRGYDAAPYRGSRCRPRCFFVSHYGAVSRCGAAMGNQTTPEAALSRNGFGARMRRSPFTKS